MLPLQDEVPCGEGVFPAQASALCQRSGTFMGKLYVGRAVGFSRRPYSQDGCGGDCEVDSVVLNGLLKCFSKR